MASDEHTHLHRVPEPLEKIFGELDAIEKVAGPDGAGEARRVKALLQEALAAQARGDAAEAVNGIMRVMQAIAGLAARIDPAEAREMSAVAEQFGRALVRGDAAEARGAADRMRDRAGARIVKKD